MAAPSNPKNYKSAMQSLGAKPGARMTIADLMKKKGKC